MTGQNAGGKLNMPNVIMGPGALLTLGNTDPSISIKDLYDTAYAAYGIVANGGQYGDGLINTGGWSSPRGV